MVIGAAGKELMSYDVVSRLKDFASSSSTVSMR